MPIARTSSLVLQYYKHKRMRSFLRQLNQYSFAKKPNNMDSTDFTHPRFVRGRRDLLNQVRRRAPGEPAVTAEAFGGDVCASDVDDGEGSECSERGQPAAKTSATQAPRKAARPSGKAKTAASGPSSKALSKNGAESSAAAPAARANAALRSSARAVRATAKAQAAVAATLVKVEDDSEDVLDSNSNSNYEEDSAEAVAVGEEEEDYEDDGARAVFNTRAVMEEAMGDGGDLDAGEAEGSFDRLLPAGALHCRLHSFLGGFGDFSDFGLGHTDNFAAAFLEHDRQGGGHVDDGGDGLLVQQHFSSASHRDQQGFPPLAAATTAATAEFILAPGVYLIGGGPDFPPPPLPTAAAWNAAWAAAAAAAVAAPTSDNASPPPLIPLDRPATSPLSSLFPVPLPPAAGGITGLGWRATSGASPATVGGLSPGLSGHGGLGAAVVPFGLSARLGFCAPPKPTAAALLTLTPPK